MVEVWVRLIESGEKMIEDCPSAMLDAVKARLVEDGYIEYTKTTD